MRKLSILFVLLLLACTTASADKKPNPDINSAKATFSNKPLQACGNTGVWLQVLGSGGPELTDKRASSGYLVWIDGKSRVLVDAGSGTAFNFEQAGGKFEELDLILLSHLHVDHSADLPAFIKGSYFIKRTHDLAIIGPSGNNFMPATDDFGQRLFENQKGAYQYLGNFLLTDEQSSASYRVHSQVYQKPVHTDDKKIKARAVSVKHGPLPALAWRLDINKQSIVFSGDMAEGDAEFIALLNEVDLFVAHNAIPEGTSGVGRRLHMPPSVIGEYAYKGKVKELLLSHRMKRTLGAEAETIREIKRKFSGSIDFADDLECFEIN